MPERPRGNHPGPPRSPVTGARRLLLAAGVCLGALLFGWVPTAHAAASVGPHGQNGPVPGISLAGSPDGGNDGESVTTTSVALLGPTEGSDVQTDSQRASSRVQWVVIALLVLAVVVVAASVVFWRRSDPDRVAGNETARASRRVGELSDPIGAQPPGDN